MADHKFAEKTEHDLEDIIDYTFQRWRALQTQTYLDGLETRGQLLADSPDLGTNRKAISEGLLSFPYESHILYYMKQPHGITVVRVLHQNMDPMKHL